MLTFPYWEELRDDQPRLLPLIPLTIDSGRSINPLDFDPEVLKTLYIKTYALVDSGAEHNVFGIDVAEELSLDLTDLPEVTIAGVGGEPMPGHLTELELQLGEYSSHHPHYFWTPPVILSPAVTEQPLLGQIGFFDHFNVTLRYRHRDIRITRTR